MKTRIYGVFILAALVILFIGSKHFLNSSSGYTYRKQPPIEHLRINNPTLLKQYVINDPSPDYKSMIYRPRQFKNGADFNNMQISDAGLYNGWDVLTATGTIQLYLNRPAVIAVSQNVNQWQQSGSITVNNIRYPVYKSASGKLSMTIEGRGRYLVLLAEQNGKPSGAPKSLLNHTVPVANATCPDWVHDEYKAVGPDGKLYPTWHPQIDPVYWCYFNHEHGTDPSLFDKNFRIPFGYAGGKMDMHEAHPGFKSYVWDDNYGHMWLAMQHQGTSTNQAACGRHHELDVAAKDKHTGEIVSEQYFVGDYGLSRPIHSTEPFRPSSCPDQGNKEAGNVGVRFIPVKGIDKVLDEPWTVNGRNIVGFNFADFTVETYDPARMCADMTCDSIVYTGESGTNRSIGYVSGFGPKSGDGHNGIYYTDSMGMRLVSADQPGAVRQYIKPGVSISSNIPYTSQQEANCRDIEGTGGIMKCGIGLKSISAARENSIKIPN